MDIESKTDNKTLMPNTNQDEDLRRKRRRKICIIIMVVVGILVALAVLFIILAFTVFKAKHPVTTVNSVSLDDVKVSFDITKLRVFINATLLIDLMVDNPNRVGMKYDQSVAYLRYKDQEVGEAPVEEGEIGAKETKPMNLTMKLMADRLLFDSDVYSQARSGALPLSTYVEISGKVKVLLFNIKVKSSSTCNFNIDVMSQGLSDLTCHYKTKV
ncbi:hypothetical protein Leryth_005349 [Lithospermum erythrorhizon]|nr:hypothetical protein Leryth_005349 [Lithospermum erythrorhizon]